MNEKKSLVITICLLVISTTAISAQHFKRRGSDQTMLRRSPSLSIRMLEMRKSELKITDDQMSKIKGILFSFEEKKLSLSHEIQKQQLELRKLFLEEKKEYTKIKTLLSKMSESRQGLLLDGLKIKEEVKDILTSEQKEALKNLTRERWENRRDVLRGRRLDAPGIDRMQRFSRIRNWFRK